MKKLTFIFALAVLARGQDPFSLKEAVRQSMARSKVIEASRAARDAASARVTEAKGGLLPKVNYSESWARSDNPVFVFSSLLAQRQFSESNFGLASLNRPGFLNNFQSLVTADQPLYEAGKTRRAVRTAQLGEDLSCEDSRRSRLEVIAQVVRFYYDTQLGAEEVKVTAQAMRSAEADLERSEARRASGMATDADVLSIRVHLAGVREEQIRRSADLEVARAAMNDAIGLPLDSAHSLTTTRSLRSRPSTICVSRRRELDGFDRSPLEPLQRRRGQGEDRGERSHDAPCRRGAGSGGIGNPPAGSSGMGEFEGRATENCIHASVRGRSPGKSSHFSKPLCRGTEHCDRSAPDRNRIDRNTDALSGRCT